MSGWRLIGKEVKTYQFEQEPELIHVIKTGFVDRYFVVYEDAYEICNGMVVESLTKEGLMIKFGIDIDAKG